MVDFYGQCDIHIPVPWILWLCKLETFSSFYQSIFRVNVGKQLVIFPCSLGGFPSFPVARVFTGFCHGPSPEASVQTSDSR